MNTPWSTTLTELLGVLRQALAALVPVAEKARIPWRDGEAYDDWDAIAACLYDNLVVRPISCAAEVEPGITLPKYDMLYPSYRGAFIQVEGGGVPEGVTAVFVGFGGLSADFGTVKWTRVLPSGEVAEEKIQLSSYDACKFHLVHGEGERRVRLHALTIDM